MSNRKPSTSRRVYLVVLFVSWLILSGYLIKQNYVDTNRAFIMASLATGIKELPSDSEWMNIYHNGKKMGYSLYSLSNMGSDGYGISSTTKLRPVIAGTNTDVSIFNRVKVDTLFRLKSFDFRLLSDKLSTQIEGQREGTELKLTIRQGKEATTQTLSLPENTYSYLGLQPMVAWQGIKPGDHIKVPSFDPVSMEMGEMEIIHEGKEFITIDNIEYQLNKIRVEFRGIPSLFWLDDNGLTYREQSVLGLVMERTTPTKALQFPDESVDIIEAYAVPVNPSIDNPERLRELVLELDGLDPSYLSGMESARQQIIRNIPLQIRLKPIAIPASEESLVPYLIATPTLESGDPRIISMAKTITKDLHDQISKINALTDWVFRNLEKRPVVSLGSAVEILENKMGDCSEHTTLYTALSRSLGIPTKMNIGIVYLQGRFLYHAWPSVFIEDEWLAVDPSLGQHRADATHIAFLEGDFSQVVQLIPILGKIQIKILEQYYPPNP